MPVAAAVLPLASLALLLAPVPSTAQEGPRELTLLDVPGDRVDGPGLAATLEAYVSDAGVEVHLAETVDPPPADHPAWVALATAIGASRGALGVMWLEPSRDEGDGWNTLLVILECASGAVIVLPVELGARRDKEMLRVLAATTRMVLDTEILDDLRKVVDTARRDPVPGPPSAAGPAPDTPPAAPSPPPSARSFTLHMAYAGDLGFGGPTVLHGGRLGALFNFNGWGSVGFDIGYLAGARESTLDITTREQRLPVRLGVVAALPLGRTRLAALFFWAVEMLWAGVEQRSRTAPAEDDIIRADTGGGAALRWTVLLHENLGVFVAVSGQGMAVSHSYVRLDEAAVHPSYFRMGWSLGLELGDL